MKKSFVAAFLFVTAASAMVVGCDQNKKVDNALIGLNQCNVVQSKGVDGTVGNKATSCSKASVKEVMQSVSLARKEGKNISVSVEVAGFKLI